MTSQTASPFAQAAPALSDLGFHCIPVMSADAGVPGAGKAPGSWTGSGWRGLARWQRFCTQPMTGFELSLAMRAPGSNLGVCLGSPAGVGPGGEQLRLIAVDLDCSGDELDALQRVLKRSPMTRVGRIGEARLYRAPATIVSQSFDRPASADAKAKRLVDLLAHGRQVVLPGSIHPITMAPYRWVGDGPCRPDELPVFDEGDLEKLLEALECLGWSRSAGSGPEVEPRAPRVAGSYADDWEEANGEGLARVGEWFPLLGLPKTRQVRPGVWCAVPVWRDSGTGRPTEQRKANLSASAGIGGTAAGIRDWGAAAPDDRLTAIDLVSKARDLEPAGALEWLRTTLGLDDDGAVIDLSDLAADATERKTAPTSLPATGGADAVSPGVMAGDEATTREVQHNAEPKTTHGADALTELPEHLTRCPGLLGQMVDWITDTSRKPQRVLSLAHALGVLGTIAGRKFSGPTDSATHLFFLCLARTGAGKGAPKKAVGQLLSAAGLRPLLGPGSFQSSSALIQHVSRTPASLCILDEFGVFMSKLNARNNSTHERQISGELRQFWSLSFEEYVPPKWASSATRQDLAPIIAPSLSVVGLSTPDEMYAALQGSDVVSGFINRWCVLATDTNPADTDPRASVFDPPADLVAGLKALAEAGGMLANATMHNMQADKPMFRVGWECSEAHAVFKALAGEMANRTEHEALTQRTAEIAVRLATIRAIGVSGENATVSVDDMTWGAAVARWSTERLIADVDAHLVESDHQRRAKNILRIIRDYPEPVMSRTALCRRLNNSLRSREIDEALQGLIEAAQVEKVPMNKLGVPTPGRPPVGYRAL